MKLNTTQYAAQCGSKPRRQAERCVLRWHDADALRRGAATPSSLPSLDDDGASLEAALGEQRLPAGLTLAGWAALLGYVCRGPGDTWRTHRLRRSRAHRLD